MTLTNRKSETEGEALQVDELPMNCLPICHQRRRGNDGELKHKSQEKKEIPTTYHYLSLLTTTCLDLNRPKSGQLHQKQ